MRAACILVVFFVLVAKLGAPCADEAPAGGPQPAAHESERAAALLRAKQLNQQVVALHREGRYRDAAARAREVLALRERALGRDHPDVAGALHNLSGMLRILGRYEEAEPLMLRALRIWEQSAGSNARQVAFGLNNLALLYRTLGRFDQARPLYERALAIQEEMNGEDHRGVAVVLGNLAELLRLQGQFDQALPLYLRALDIEERSLGPRHPDVAASLNNLGVLSRNRGRHEEAQRFFERAVDIWAQTRGPQALDLARGLHNLAFHLSTQGRIREAIPPSERALGILEERLGPEHPEVAVALNNYAMLLGALGRRAEAEKLYDRAGGILEMTVGRDDPRVAKTLRNRARVLVTLARVDEASALLARSLRIEEHNLQRYFVALEPRARLRLLTSARAALDDWLHLVPRLGNTGYEEVLRLKGLAARVAAAERRWSRRGGAQATSSLRELRAAERRLARLVHAIPPTFRRDARAAWGSAYAKAAAEREQWALALAQASTPDREGVARLELTLRDIQARLAEGELLVDVLCTGGRYLAWLVPPEGDVVRLDLGATDVIEEATASFCRSCAGTDPRALGVEGEKAGRALRSLLIEPITTRFGQEVRTVILCPDAALATLPFAALPGKEEGHYLIDDVLLIQISMAQDVVPWKDDLTSGKGVLAVGDVDYSLAEVGTNHAVQARSEELAALARPPRGPGFPGIPHTGREIGFLEARLGDACTVLRGAGATEARFRAEAPGRGILHLATHGFVYDDLMRGLRRREGNAGWLGAAHERLLAVGHDPLCLAGLAMAGANGRVGGYGDDGILTALEASYLDLDGVDLVVLSACETARGKAESGEGVLGLVRGFRMAGAGRIIASLWQVDDEATRLLMEHLYEAMLCEEDPLAPAEALRAAMLRVRHSRGENERSFAAPKHWASFLCYGL